MAEEKKNQPLSLNERHYRFLQSLPQNKPHSSSIPHTPSDEVKQLKINIDDDIPQFSGIVDLDSPSPVEAKHLKKFDLDDSSDRPILDRSYCTDFDSHPPVAEKPSNANMESKVSSRNYNSNAIEASSHKVLNSGSTNFTSQPEEDKPRKVKIEGRRRLCKLSSNNDNQDGDSKNQAENDGPELYGISDFDKPRIESSYGGDNEIRDILNELNSRLDDLSIQKKRVPKTVGLVKVSSDFDVKEVNNQLKKKEFQKFTSAASSLSFESSNSTSDSIIVSRVEDRLSNILNECGNESDLESVSKGDNFIGELNREGDSITLSGSTFTYTLPARIAKMLYPHQRDGLKWLWTLHCQGKGGILGDDMGLGKTMQICGFLAGLFHSSLIKRALIVAPKTLIPHWIKELSAVGLSETIREYFGTCAKARQYELQYILQDKGVLLTTYDIVRNNAKSLRGDYYFHDDRSEDDITWDYMILDEGHLIKNPSTQRAKSLLEIPCAHRIIISGTPIQNNLKELWALFNFCCPELLGDKHWFKEKYEHLILRGNDKNASDREKRIGSTVAKDLREHIQPYFLRRLKSEVFNEDNGANIAKLSKKNEIIVWLRLASCQRQLYEAFLKSEIVLSAFDGSPLAALTILKKICDHPLLLTKRAAEDVLEGMDSISNQEEHGVAEKLAMHIADLTERFDFVEKHDSISCKISFILSLLDNLIPQGHNVLIFSQTRKMLNLIQESLVSNGFEFLRIDGTTKASDRVKIVNDFQEGVRAPIFLLTSQVGGLGLTLTKADRVIVVDPAWNPSTDNQSVDRAYRIGQEKDVLVYRLMTCGTVEEKIYRKQIFKGGLFKSATEHKEQIRYFCQQDLRELFSLPKQGFDISLTQEQLHEEHDRQHIMDDSLKTHINFLETLGIAGVSHHSLLFSKTAPVPVIQDEEEVTRLKGTTFAGKSYSSASLERNVDSAEYAFNPRDVERHRKMVSPSITSEPTEADIKGRIYRLSQIFANKVTISKLPDKGEKIQRQITDLNLELDNIRMAKRTENETIHLDAIAGEHELLNV